MRLFKGSDELRLPLCHAGKLFFCSLFSETVAKDTYNEIVRFSDLNPTWNEVKRWIAA